MSANQKLTEFEQIILESLKKNQIIRWQNCSLVHIKALNRLVKKGYARAELIDGYVAWWEPI